MGAVCFCSAEKGGLFLVDQPAILTGGVCERRVRGLTAVWDGSRECSEGASCLQSCHSRASNHSESTEEPEPARVSSAADHTHLKASGGPTGITKPDGISLTGRMILSLHQGF